MSLLSKSQYRRAWAIYDLSTANRLLDEIGLTTRDENGIRLLPDGRRAIIIVDAAGESTEDPTSFELIKDSRSASLA